jgi:autophagy-related protein 5
MTTASLRGQGQRQASVGSVSGALLSPNMAQAGLHQPSSTSGQATSAAARSALHFRHLIWDATIPIAISIDSAELPEGVRLDRAVETYYVCAPRISYLPLLLEKLQMELLSLMISDEEALQQIKPESCWFTYEGVPLRW